MHDAELPRQSGLNDSSPAGKINRDSVERHALKAHWYQLEFSNPEKLI
jgi:hypothetical protein